MLINSFISIGILNELTERNINTVSHLYNTI